MNEEKQLQEWLEEVISYRPLRRLRFTEKNGRGSVIFSTAAHSYHLSFTEDYLGCTASNRTQRPGETWTRGNDLPDGKFNRETFDRIIQAILAYEIVDLAPVIEPVAVPAN